jgi:hypothetical protein
MTILRRSATALLLTVGPLLYLAVETAPRIHF